MRKLFISLSLLLFAVASHAAPLVTDTVAPAFQGKHIMVITLQKKMRPEATVTHEYQAWTVMSSAAMEIFQNVKPISESDLGAKFTDLPVYMAGKCRIDAQNYTYELNAGSFLKLTQGSEVTYYGCWNKKLSKYFLKGPKS